MTFKDIKCSRPQVHIRGDNCHKRWHNKPPPLRIDERLFQGYRSLIKFVQQSEDMEQDISMMYAFCESPSKGGSKGMQRELPVSIGSEAYGLA